MPEMDPERRRILLASATLAALGGSGMAPRPAQEDDQTEEAVPESIMPKQDAADVQITPEIIAHAEMRGKRG